jgi:ABC-type glycerol-3-phosphate transport system permease component
VRETRGRTRPGRVVNIGIQLVIAFFTFFPFYFMFVSSLKSNNQILERYFGVMTPFHLENYVRAASRVSYYMLNSLIICGVTVVGVILLSCVSAFVFARYEFPGKKALFMIILGFLMMPGILTLIPQFVLVVRLHLNGTYWAAILPYIAFGQIIAIFILRSFIEGIPKDLFDSATIDGARPAVSFRHIVIPLAKPIITSLALMNFLANWNDFIWPLLVLSREKTKTITVGLYAFTDVQQIQYGVLFAGFIIASVPLIILFSLNMRFFIRGMTAGAIKA